MNDNKWCAIVNIFVLGTFIIAVTTAAIHFEKASLLWWYVLLPLMTWSVESGRR